MKQWILHSGRAFARLYPDTARVFVLAPAVLALVVVPEFLQHVAEISLGMFDSREAFRASASDPLRMALGIAKLAGLVLVMLATARWWWSRGHDGHWADLRRIAWLRLLPGLLLFFGVPSLAALAGGRGPAWLEQALGWALSVAMLPTLFLAVAGLFGDRRTPLALMWRRGWPALLLTVLLVVLAFAPAQWLHQMNHQWALGAPPLVVWALMVFDSLLVGFLAAGVGTALFLGYRTFQDTRPAAEVDAREPVRAGT
jgi:hypothetical protein